MGITLSSYPEIIKKDINHSKKQEKGIVCTLIPGFFKQIFITLSVLIHFYKTALPIELFYDSEYIKDTKIQFLQESFPTVQMIDTHFLGFPKIFIKENTKQLRENLHPQFKENVLQYTLYCCLLSKSRLILSITPPTILLVPPLKLYQFLSSSCLLLKSPCSKKNTYSNIYLQYKQQFKYQDYTNLNLFILDKSVYYKQLALAFYLISRHMYTLDQHQKTVNIFTKDHNILWLAFHLTSTSYPKRIPVHSIHTSSKLTTIQSLYYKDIALDRMVSFQQNEPYLIAQNIKYATLQTNTLEFTSKEPYAYTQMSKSLYTKIKDLYYFVTEKSKELDTLIQTLPDKFLHKQHVLVQTKKAQLFIQNKKYKESIQTYFQIVKKFPTQDHIRNFVTACLLAHYIPKKELQELNNLDITNHFIQMYMYNTYDYTTSLEICTDSLIHTLLFYGKYLQPSKIIKYLSSYQKLFRAFYFSWLFYVFPFHIQGVYHHKKIFELLHQKIQYLYIHAIQINDYESKKIVLIYYNQREFTDLVTFLQSKGVKVLHTSQLTPSLVYNVQSILNLQPKYLLFLDPFDHLYTYQLLNVSNIFKKTKTFVYHTARITSGFQHVQFILPEKLIYFPQHFTEFSLIRLQSLGHYHINIPTIKNDHKVKTSFFILDDVIHFSQPFIKAVNEILSKTSDICVIYQVTPIEKVNQAFLKQIRNPFRVKFESIDSLDFSECKYVLMNFHQHSIKNVFIALYHNIPILSRQLKYLRGSVTSSICLELGLKDFVTYSYHEFIQKAIQFSKTQISYSVSFSSFFSSVRDDLSKLLQ